MEDVWLDDFSGAHGAAYPALDPGVDASDIGRPVAADS